MKRLSLIVLLLVLATSIAGSIGPASAQREPVPPWREPMPAARSTAEIVVGDTPLTVELALASDEQSLGLGYRNGLEPGTGMLFVFPEPAERSFWMKGMRFCLDIIWIANGEVVGAAENACPDPEGTADADRPNYLSEVPVTHVLEVPAGWIDEHGYGPGTTVELPGQLG
jgi:uncharacterized membrane protein (UPF0127 family)